MLRPASELTVLRDRNGEVTAKRLSQVHGHVIIERFERTISVMINGDPAHSTTVTPKERPSPSDGVVNNLREINND